MNQYVPVATLICIIGVVLLAPFFLTIDPMKTNPQLQFQPPGDQYVLGTDLLGRDVLSRAVFGGQRSLLIAGLAVGMATAVGLPLGLIAASWGRPLAQVLLIVIQALLALPGLVLALVVVTVLGRNFASLILAVGLSQIAPFASIVRSTVLSVQSEGYIDAARSMGATRRHLLVHHILPGIEPAVLAYAGVMFSYALLNGAALSFLGLGGEPGVPDWGVMLAEGRAAFRIAPWIALAPGLAITFTVWAVNRVVDQIQNRQLFTL